MDEPRAQRTLVKSPPELWAEVSDVEALAGHLGAFGEIRITRLDPETTVAWEGDRARGTVELEPSGWGTKVTLTARIDGEREDEPEPVAPPEAVAQPEPEPEAEDPEPALEREPEPDPAPAKRPGLFARLFGRRRERAARAPEPLAPPPPAREPESEPERDREPEPETPAAPAASERGRDGLDPERAEAILVGVLDDLGAARHRPFSRG
jgi:hypothetical protein